MLDVTRWRSNGFRDDRRGGSFDHFNRFGNFGRHGFFTSRFDRFGGFGRHGFFSRRGFHRHFGFADFCFVHSRRHHGLHFSFGWGWPFGCFYGFGYGLGWWPGYYYSSSWPFYYDYLYSAPVQYQYTSVSGYAPGQGVVYEELPPVELPSPAQQAAEPGAPARFESQLAPMLGGREDVGAVYALGEDRFRHGEFAAAVAAFEESVRLGQADPSARIALSLALIGAEDYSGAVRMLQVGLQEIDDVGSVALDADALFPDAAVWTDALDRLRDASQRDPANADLMFLMGFAQFATGNLREATQYLWSAYDAGMSDAGLAEVLLAAEARLRAQ